MIAYAFSTAEDSLVFDSEITFWMTRNSEILEIYIYIYVTCMFVRICKANTR